jgi:(p)ppGpp synthase/HD superfamily hydrolase
MKNLDHYLPQTTDNLSKLLIAVGQDVRVIIIKLADRLHNLSTLQHMKPEKQQKIARESLNVFAPMADRLGMGQVRMRIEEIAFSYLEPKEFKRLKLEMKRRLGKSTRKLGVVRSEVERELTKHGIHFEVNGRVKSIYSLHKKLQKVNGNIDDIYDLMALRIIVDTKEDCYRVLGILHSLYQPMIARIKDYIAIPKPNGYQSLHTTVITPAKQIVEFQNRIFVYSPRGDIYNLPEGALPLDFAYLIHSDIGKYTYAFRVNGNIRAFDQPLENGDVVEVITRKLPQVKKAWLDLVKTTHARNKLRMQLKQLGLIEGITSAAAIIREKTVRKKRREPTKDS